MREKYLASNTFHTCRNLILSNMTQFKLDILLHDKKDKLCIEYLSIYPMYQSDVQISTDGVK